MHRRPATKGHRDRTSPQRVARTALEAEALRLRRDGHAFDEIAEMLGGTMNEGKVEHLIRSALERKGKPDANAIRDDLLDRMDRLYNRAWRIAQKDGPDRVAAINAGVNVAARMAALVGTDAPKQVDIKDDRQLPIDEAAAAKLVERLAEEARREESGGGPDAAHAAAGGEASSAA